MKKLSITEQFEILSIGNNEIQNEITRRELFANSEEYERRNELFTFTNEEFVSWTKNVDINRFCFTQKGSGDGLYFVKIDFNKWELYWQERGFPEGEKLFFSDESEGRIRAIASRLNVILWNHPILKSIIRS